MPAEAQVLYFHMVLRADDDGVVESYPLMKLLGSAPDSFKVLQVKGFIRQLNEDQVIVISDWLEHNVIRADRKVNSIYAHLLEKVAPDIPRIEPKPRSDVEDNSARVGGPSTGGISKVRLGKDKLNTPIAAIAAPFSLKEEIQKLYESDRRDLNLIGWYFEKRRVDIRDRGQFNSALKRHLRAAKELSPFTDEQLTKAWKYVASEYPEWTLETITKKLTK